MTSPATKPDCQRLGGCIGETWCTYCGVEIGTAPPPPPVVRPVLFLAEQVERRRAARVLSLLWSGWTGGPR